MTDTPVRRILIVDDMLPNAMIAAATLEQLGHVQCETVESGEEALALCKKGCPDLLVTDYLMPEMNGLELIGKVRALYPKQLIPVIVVTADSDRTMMYMALEGRATDVVRKPFDELELLARAGNMLEMRADRLALQEANRRLELLATTDSLTGVRNRRAFLDRGQSEVSRARRNGGPLSILMLDIDHFKSINDTHGHAAGDHALKVFTKAVSDTLRETDIIGRLGGEEFAALLPETPRVGAADVAERLRDAVSAVPVDTQEGSSFNMTVSIGVTLFDGQEQTDLDTLLNRADKALYVAKTNGRNRVEMG